MNYTSIEQSKKLLELGLDRETADMCYSSYDLPRWSIGALIDATPKVIYKENHTFYQNIRYDPEFEKYVFDYKDYQHGGRCINTSMHSEFLFVIYDMLVYLLKNGYIQK